MSYFYLFTDPNEEALELATPTCSTMELLHQGAGESLFFCFGFTSFIVLYISYFCPNFLSISPLQDLLNLLKTFMVNMEQLILGLHANFILTTGYIIYSTFNMWT